ncbi:hypothetical protein PRIC2_005567 [Phytophthora ramorum]
MTAYALALASLTSLLSRLRWILEKYNWIPSTRSQIKFHGSLIKAMFINCRTERNSDERWYSGLRRKLRSSA